MHVGMDRPAVIRVYDLDIILKEFAYDGTFCNVFQSTSSAVTRPLGSIFRRHSGLWYGLTLMHWVGISLSSGAVHTLRTACLSASVIENVWDRPSNASRMVRLTAVS